MSARTYKTISAPASGSCRSKGSRFLSFAWPVHDEGSVKTLLHTIRKEHPKANHVCYAFRLGPHAAIFRYFDDREPAGTAGKPLFGVLQSQALTDVLVVVVRYFGGTLLGVRGLIESYRSAAADAIANAQIEERPVVETWHISAPYEYIHEIMEIVRLHQGSCSITGSGVVCDLTAVFPEGRGKELAQLISHDARLSARYRLKPVSQ